MSAWEDLELIREERNGEEGVYRCPDCGKPKLYLNYVKRVYNCFACGKAGKAVARTFTLSQQGASPPPKEFRPPEVKENMVSRAENNLKVRGIDPAIAPWCDVFSTAASPWILRIRLYDYGDDQGKNVIGIHSYDRLNNAHRYYTAGERGITTLNWDLETPGDVILLEGLFDYLSVAELYIQEDHSDLVPGVPLPIFTCGNTLSMSQAASVRHIWQKRGSRILRLGFDRDKPFAFLKLLEEFGLYGCVRACPPVEPYKDWDEMIQKDRITAIKRLKQPL